jgi:transposase InsO family protein
VVSRYKRQDMVLLAHVSSAFAPSNGTYGSPRMTRELRDQGLTVGRRRTARLMRDNGLADCPQSIGWSVSDRLHRNLALAALRRGFAIRCPEPGLICHSDRGSQGGFKRSSQHHGIGGCDEGLQTSIGAVHAQKTPIAWAPAWLAA